MFGKGCAMSGFDLSSIGNGRFFFDHSIVNFYLFTAVAFLIVSVVTALISAPIIKAQNKNTNTASVVTDDKPQPSSMNKYKLSWTDGTEGRYFAVVDGDSHETIYLSEPLYIKGNATLLWGENDMIWLYDDAVSLRFWVHDEKNGKWIEKIYTKNPGTPYPPKVLLQLYPKLYI
jgi:hypothetical protein